MQPVPEAFARRIAEMHGASGRAWLDDLPALLADCARRWSLTLLPPFPNLTYNYVAPALRSDGEQVVVKVGVPSHPDILSEMDALRIFDGRGCVRMLDADRERLVVLLERLRPGTALSRVNDDGQATTFAAQVMRSLWRPAPTPHAFRTLAQWSGGIFSLRTHPVARAASFPIALVTTAERLCADLLGSTEETMLLHGDLWHDNILAAQREPWLAIDAQGVVGERAADAAALLSSPLPHLLHQPQPARILARRVSQLSEQLDLDRGRLIAWGVVYAVLLAWWYVEDHVDDWEAPLACAELLAAML
ncbi:MAG: aminoglycoside phosphotransferase family protein [Chloroflexi bacterium]|nr:aminoglycoside phosphotransferase family protein [Chloroflexota bacterium]